MQWMAIAIGGAAGALARWFLGGFVYAVLGTAFPWGTLLVNIVGCLGLGLIAAFTESAVSGDLLGSALGIGFLGAFTTFSTFSLESLRLMQDGEPARAAAYVLASVGLGLTAVWVGLEAGRWVVMRAG